MRLTERARLIDALSAVPGLVDRHASWDGSFVPAVLQWCRDVEAVLASLRSPLVSLVAAERARIGAAGEPAEGERRGGRSRAQRAAALAAMGPIEAALRARVEAIDAELLPVRDKLIQFLAVSSARQPIPFPPPAPRLEWLRKVWPTLLVADDMRNMYAYLSAALPESDRLALLDETIEQLLSGNGQLFK